jgi:hypothetical protein
MRQRIEVRGTSVFQEPCVHLLHVVQIPYPKRKVVDRLGLLPPLTHADKRELVMIRANLAHEHDFRPVGFAQWSPVRHLEPQYPGIEIDHVLELVDIDHGMRPMKLHGIPSQCLTPARIIPALPSGPSRPPTGIGAPAALQSRVTFQGE